MRDFINIVEYQLINSGDFQSMNFSSGEKVGSISTKAGQCHVWQIEDDNEMMFGAILRDGDPKNP
jgi:hypothetical protein